MAWSLIKQDGKFLFHLREDTKKRNDRKSGDYGLIGGRINQADIEYISDAKQRIQMLQSESLVEDDQCFENALKREIREEIGLEFGEHYTFSPMQTLVPYEQVEGAAPNHGLTRYFFRLFTVDLNLDGYLVLHQKLKESETGELIWCSVEDMLNLNCNGDLLYIQALHDHYRGGVKALKESLERVENCHRTPCKIMKETHSDAIVFPVLPNYEIKSALDGSKHLADFPIENKLSDDDVNILLGLAAHMRGYEFESIELDVSLLPDGWVDLSENLAFKNTLIDLTYRLPEFVEKHADRWFRMSIQPEMIFFDEQLFQFSVNSEELDDYKSKNKKTDITLYRSPFSTLLGSIKGVQVSHKTTKERIRFFMACYKNGGISASGHNSHEDDARSFDNLRSVMDSWSKKIGLRKAIGQSDSLFKIFIKEKI